MSRKYKLVGAKQLKCLPSGTYDNDPPVCKGNNLNKFKRKLSSKSDTFDLI